MTLFAWTPISNAEPGLYGGVVTANPYLPCTLVGPNVETAAIVHTVSSPDTWKVTLTVLYVIGLDDSDIYEAPPEVSSNPGPGIIPGPIACSSEWTACAFVSNLYYGTPEGGWEQIATLAGPCSPGVQP